MAASGTAGTIRIEGLRELQRAFRRIDEKVATEMRHELLAIAEMVAETARQYAVGRGLVDDEHAPPGGGLVDAIKPRALGAAAMVADSARRVSAKYPGGYNYPARYEFENGGARSFMRPAVDHDEARSLLLLEGFLGRIGREEGF
jgi:hypothetical protein